MEITNELLAAYAENNVSPQEREAVRQYLTLHPDQLEAVMMMMDEDFCLSTDGIRSEDGADSIPVRREKGSPKASGLSATDDGLCSNRETSAQSIVLPRYGGMASAPPPVMSCFIASDHLRTDDEMHSREREDQDVCLNETGCEGTAHGMSFAERLDNLLDEVQPDIRRPAASFRRLPAMAKAALNDKDNFCALRCEAYALRHFGMQFTEEELLAEAQQNGWFTPEGMALHNIGRLAGLRGLGVSHRYACRLEDIENCISQGMVVIAAVDGGELFGDIEAERLEDLLQGCRPDHVVIVREVNRTDGTVTLSDNTSFSRFRTFPIERFDDAWDDSDRHIIVVSKGDSYEPHPIDLADVPLSDDLQELREAIAENAHEVWAEGRRREGWTYGPRLDDAKKEHPDMVQYNLLPESEKQHHRDIAMNTIKLVKKLGWDISKKK